MSGSPETSLLEKAISLAVTAHRGQTDKAGAPYILHPMRMMFRMVTEEAMMAAVLHDVVEDTEWTLEGLRREGFPETVVGAVDSLTRRKGDGESYEDFIERAGTHPIGRQVKMADLRDNMDLSRIAEPTDKDWNRIQRYHRALMRLLKMEDLRNR